MGCTNTGGGMSNRAFNGMSTTEQMRTILDLQKQISRAQAAETRADRELAKAYGAVRMTYADDKKRLREREKAAKKALTKKNKKTAAKRQLQKRLDRYSEQYHKDFGEQTSLF